MGKTASPSPNNIYPSPAEQQWDAPLHINLNEHDTTMPAEAPGR